MTTNISPSIYFLEVADNAAKLQCICNTTLELFYKNKKILIAVATNEAAIYIDQLLWKQPEESFLPHVVSKSAVNDRVVITTAQANLNQAEVLINLCSDTPSNFKAYQTIYELMDLTHPEKKALSEKRLAAYKAAGFSPII